MNDARKLILEMVKEGRISPDEAVKLLEALDGPAPATEPATSGSRFRVSPMVAKDGKETRRFWIQRVPGEKAADSSTRAALKRVEIKKDSPELADLLRALGKSE